MPTIVILDASADATDALLDRIMRRTPAVATAATEAAFDPDLPSPFVTPNPGERYAGVVLVEGKPSHHLFLLPAKPAGKLNHKDALAWAASVGGELPERFEAALLYANLKSEFETSDYYWTATQYSAAVAWIQGFFTGSQSDYVKYDECLARAVRRLEI
jgi:hypothetical protein